MIKMTLIYLDEGVPPKKLAFKHTDLAWHLSNESKVGPIDFDELTEDLLDVGMSIFHLERYIYAFRGSPIVRTQLVLPVRNPRHWMRTDVISTIGNTLNCLLPINWELTFVKKSVAKNKRPKGEHAKVSQVVLFSGGMDSTCGIAAFKDELRDSTRFVSYYTKQKTVQQSILNDCGYDSSAHLSQFTSEWTGKKIDRRNKTFFCRSFMFLTLGAAIARSHGSTKILQFENGILATAVPPAPSLQITKHAHPFFHLQMGKFLTAYFQQPFEIENPFLWMTKRQAYERAKASITNFEFIVTKSETCWYHYSNFGLDGKKKKPNIPCGICIPCLIRRVSDPNFDYQFDIALKGTRDDRVNFIFQSYLAIVERIEESRNESEFYFKVLDGATRTYVDNHVLPIDKLFTLFKRFSRDFRKEFPN